MLIKLIMPLCSRRWSLFLFFLFSISTQSAEIPRLNAWVIDETKTLSQQQINTISEKLANHENDSGNQIVILLVKTVDHEKIEHYARRVFNNWQLGQQGKENGVLLVIAKNDHRIRIEVGADLTQLITEAKVKQIINQNMKPLIAQNNYFTAINTAVDNLISIALSNQTTIKNFIPNWPISITFISCIFALVIPFSLYFLSGHLFKKQFSLKDCYILYFIPAIALSFALLTLFGSSIKSLTITFIYCITITLSSYISIGLLLYILQLLRKNLLHNKKPL